MSFLCTKYGRLDRETQKRPANIHKQVSQINFKGFWSNVIWKEDMWRECKRKTTVDAKLTVVEKYWLYTEKILLRHRDTSFEVGLEGKCGRWKARRVWKIMIKEEVEIVERTWWWFRTTVGKSPLVFLGWRLRAEWRDKNWLEKYCQRVRLSWASLNQSTLSN